MATKTENSQLQSVFVSDQDVVKLYPREMTNDEIDYDIHTNVRGKPPEDYYINFLPLSAIQRGFREVAEGGLLGQVVEKGLKLGMDENVEPALKFIAVRPDIALGMPYSDASPEEIEKVYKPWIDIWREDVVGRPESVSPPSFAPWFLVEFMPSELLEFGSKPLNWVGSYGVEKFGPPVLNAFLSRLPEKARSILLKDIFAGEKSLAKDFDVLGVPMNSRTSQVVDAYKKGARVVHPDVGGSQEEFIALKTAYENIMKSRGGWFDKLFDNFRATTSGGRTAAEPRGVLGLLSDEAGSAMVPFSNGDIVRVGNSFGKVVKMSGKIASVNIAGKIAKVKIEDMESVTGLPSEESSVNLNNLIAGDEARIKILEATQELGKEIENKTGKKLGHEEVIEAAKTADILSQGVSREATLKFEASLLKTREHLAALAEENKLTPEFLDALRIVANTGTDIARSLESMKIMAMPEFAEVKVKVIRNIMKLGHSSEEILKAAEGVDFKDEQSVAKFYRQFVKPKLSEILDEYAYINILSSPLTHIVNTTSNLIQMAGLNPLTKLASGAIDFTISKLTGKDRVHYASAVPDFYKGAINALPEAVNLAVNIMRGKKTLERPDIKHIPTLSKLVDWGTLKVGKYFPRALEASDVFFRTMVEAGEVEALSRRLGHAPSEAELKRIKKEAVKRAEYYVFRQKPDSENASGQGDFLSAIDNMTNAVYRLRSVPGFKWFIRFVQTPMNIFKQSLEYSPAGLATMKGAKDKAEQGAKTALGSLVFAGASWLAANNLTTWASPNSERDKNDFYGAGLQPYSIRFGDTWVSYSKLGPLGGPIAMAAALHYFTKESPNALSDSEIDKVVDAITGLMRFYSDQSYLQGIGDIVSFARGQKTKAFASVPTQMIPLSSLQGWVNQLIDELQRKPSKGLSFESVIDQIQMKLVGMSRFVPPQIDYEEIPVKKQMRGINAVSPARMSKVNKGRLAEYREEQEIKREENLIRKEAQE